MDPSDKNELSHDFSPLIRIYKDGRVERLINAGTVPPADPDPLTGVSSKDVVFSAETGLSVRLYLPKLPHPPRKLPILVYFHGGGFCIESAFSPTYHHFLNALCAEAVVLAVSVDYRLAPEHPLPAAYDDSWDALKWVASQAPGDAGAEPWLAEHGDFSRLVLAGDSAGANIAYQMALRAAQLPGCAGAIIDGLILLDPFFWGVDPVEGEAKDNPLREMGGMLWKFLWPSSAEGDDPHLNPIAEGAPSLKGLPCRRVLVCVAELDELKHRGRAYHKALLSSGWEGSAELVETQGEGHVFYLLKPTCEKAGATRKRLAAFLNPAVVGDQPPV